MRPNTCTCRGAVAAALLLALLLQPVYAWQARDDFQSQPAGATGEPAWLPGGVEWVIDGGVMHAGDVGRTFNIYDAAPAGHVVHIEATLRIDKAVGEDNWRVAGIAIRRDDGHYWHLALIQAPQKDEARRAVELNEMYDGRWGAQHEAATHLTNTANAGSDLHWQYDHPYRLSLTMDHDGIRGDVRDAAGPAAANTDKAPVLATLAYRFDHPAITEGKPALVDDAFAATFDNVTMSVDDPVQLPAQQQPTYPPCEITGFGKPIAPAAGYFKTMQHDGKWWIATPRGSRFFALGVDHVNYFAHWCEKLGYAPYHRYVEHQYGSQQAWSDTELQRLQSWNFNTLGAGCGDILQHRGLAHTAFLSFGTDFASTHYLVPRDHWTGFPNVFDPRWVRWCHLKARERCTSHRDDPWLLGYFIDNELRWFGQTPQWSILQWAMKLPASDPAKQAAVAMLKQRHADAASLNHAWGTKLANLDDLANLTDLPNSQTDAAKADADAFTGLCAERYFSVSCAAIRAVDPNHMILGCRFAGEVPDAVLDVAGKYLDIFTINNYPRVDLKTGHVQDLADQLTKIHDRTHLPVMITEWSFPALDAVDSTGHPLPSIHGAGMRVDSQVQRAAATRAMATMLMKLPFIVGYDYFMWADEPALGVSSSFPEDSNYGLVSESDQPYQPITQMFTKLQSETDAIHSGKLDPKWVAPPFPAAPASTPTIEHGAKITVQQQGNAVTIDNGVLKLVHGEHDPHAWQRIEYRGKMLGFFDAMVHSIQGNRQGWPVTNHVDDVQVKRQGDDAIVTMTLSCDATQWSVGYRCGWQFTIQPGRSWFEARCLWIESTDKQPWTCESYFHRVESRLGGELAGDSTTMSTNYYLDPVGLWRDNKAGVQVGVIGLDPDAFDANYWLDDHGAEHPDALRKIDAAMTLGKRFDTPQPSLIIFGGPSSLSPGQIAALVAGE